MAAFDLWAVSEAVARATQALTGIGECYPCELEAMIPPCAYVRWTLVPVLGSSFGRGTIEAEGELVLLPGEAIDAEAMRTLYGWLSGGAGGVWEALAADTTLGGTVSDVAPAVAARVGEVSSPFGDRYGAVVGFKVVARRDA